MISAIESALAAVAASIPDAVHTMTHGDESGTVVASSSPILNDEGISGGAPVENRRVVGARRDFPSLDEGAVVDLDGWQRIVTSAKTDPVGASVTIGLTAEMRPVSISGTRAGGTVRGTYPALVSNDGIDAALADIDIESGRTVVTVRVPAKDGAWIGGKPQVGDLIATGDGERFKVYGVAGKVGEYYEMKARTA